MFYFNKVIAVVVAARLLCCMLCMLVRCLRGPQECMRYDSGSKSVTFRAICRAVSFSSYSICILSVFYPPSIHILITFYVSSIPVPIMFHSAFILFYPTSSPSFKLHKLVSRIDLCHLLLCRLLRPTSCPRRQGGLPVRQSP